MRSDRCPNKGPVMRNDVHAALGRASDTGPAERPAGEIRPVAAAMSERPWRETRLGRDRRIGDELRAMYDPILRERPPSALLALFR